MVEKETDLPLIGSLPKCQRQAVLSQADAYGAWNSTCISCVSAKGPGLSPTVFLDCAGSEVDVGLEPAAL